MNNFFLGNLTNRVVTIEKMMDEMKHNSLVYAQKLDALDGVILATG